MEKDKYIIEAELELVDGDCDNCYFGYGCIDGGYELCGDSKCFRIVQFLKIEKINKDD